MKHVHDILAEYLKLTDRILNDELLHWEGERLFIINLMIKKLFQTSATLAYISLGTRLIYTENAHIYDMHSIQSLTRTILELCTDMYEIFWDATDSDIQEQRLRGFQAEALKYSSDTASKKFFEEHKIKPESTRKRVGKSLSKFGILNDNEVLTNLYGSFSGAIHSDISSLYLSNRTEDKELYLNISLPLVIRIIAFCLHKVISEFPDDKERLLSIESMHLVNAEIEAK